MAGQDRVLDRRERPSPRSRRRRAGSRAGRQAVEEVGAQLLLDGPRPPAGGAELGDGGWGGAVGIGSSSCLGGGLGAEPGRPRSVDGGRRGAARTASSRRRRRPGDEVGEVVATAVDLELEVAGRRPTRSASSGVMPQPKCSKASRRRVPGREDGRTEALDMAVLVARDRPDVVGGDDPSAAGADAAQDQDDPEMRQLVVVGADRRPAQLLEDLVERVGVDRRGEAVADRGRPDRDPRGRAPGVGRQVVGQLAGRAVRSSRGGPAAGSRRRAPRVPGQPSSDACGSQPKSSASSRELDERTSGGRKSRSAVEQGGLADAAGPGRDDDGHAPLDEQPERRGELRVEHAVTDQLDDGAGVGRDGPERPAARGAWRRPRRDHGRRRQIDR